MEWKDLVEKEFISARFILALIVIAGYAIGNIDSTTAGIILAFYFGSKVVSTVKQ